MVPSLSKLSSSDKALRQAIRILVCLDRPVSMRELVSHSQHSEEETTRVLKDLVSRGIVACEQSNTWRIKEVPKEVRVALEEISLLAESEFIKERSSKFSLDVRGRLEWIDDAREMIEFAKKNNRL